MHSLALFLRLDQRPVILLGDGAAAAAKRRLIERAGGVCVAESNMQARIAFVALDDGADAAAIRLKQRGIFVNVADRPDLCDFTLPAIVDRDPVLIAISTGGASAGLAKALRARIEALLPATLGTLARQLGEARAALRSRWPDSADRRRMVDAGLAPAGPLDPLRDDAALGVPRWLAGEAPSASIGLHRLVITSDDPDQLTLAAARLLMVADTVFHDAGIAPVILNRARADAVRLCVQTVPEVLPLGLSIHLVRETG